MMTRKKYWIKKNAHKFKLYYPLRHHRDLRRLNLQFITTYMSNITCCHTQSGGKVASLAMYHKPVWPCHTVHFTFASFLHFNHIFCSNAINLHFLIEYFVYSIDLRIKNSKLKKSSFYIIWSTPRTKIPHKSSRSFL